MNISEFQHRIFEISLSSAICDIPIVRRISPTSINLRVDLIVGGFIDVFFNQETGRVAFAFIKDDERIFGADNTGGWHIHPFNDPTQHVPLPLAMSFEEFVKQIESFCDQDR